mmetsp:Transcript_46132/g.142712  ORF Transcript_46132/g.142712 Transcript_46132/m.142712 type:complete len:385 (+) Transcript_46132:1-1155(+)
MLNLICNCASRLLDLVVNIMEMASLSQRDSRGRPKTLTLSLDSVDLKNMIEDILTLIGSSVDKAGRPLIKPGVTLSAKLSPLPMIEADANRCTQVFYNIITNACKFTLKGSITVWSRTDPGGKWVEVLVTDTGRGIPEEAMERIFQPFEQEDNSDARQFEGVGLGLSIASEVVTLHGGRISVDSEVGVGTTFGVRLPAAVGGALESNDFPSESDTPPSLDQKLCSGAANIATSSTLETLGNMRVRRKARQPPLILSVMEETIHQMVIERILEPEYEVHTVMDGPAVIKYLQNCGDALPDCVLLDMVLADMSGVELCNHIRQILMLDAEDLPVLLLATDGEPSAPAKAAECGSNDFISKPFDKHELKTHVAAAITPPEDPTLVLN